MINLIQAIEVELKHKVEAWHSARFTLDQQLAADGELDDNFMENWREWVRIEVLERDVERNAFKRYSKQVLEDIGGGGWNDLVEDELFGVTST